MTDTTRFPWGDGPAPALNCWEAAGYATGGGQKSVYNYDEMYGQGPTVVSTPQFLHDQIAKGGRRR
jgi:hypothetical protein